MTRHQVHTQGYRFWRDLVTFVRAVIAATTDRETGT